MPAVLIDNTPIPYVNQAKNLGITFNSTLNWDTHINIASGRVTGMLRSLWPIMSYIPERVRLLLAKTYLIPTLLYGCEIFAACDRQSFDRIKVTFHNIVRFVYCVKRYDSVSNKASLVLGLSLEGYLSFRVLVLLHKIIYTRNPKYLFDKLIFLASNRHFSLLNVSFKRLISQRQFYINAIRLWNSLSNDIRIIQDPIQFKRKLWDYLS